MFNYVLCKSYFFQFLVSECFNTCFDIAISVSTVCRCVAAYAVQYSVSSHYTFVAVTVPDFRYPRTDAKAASAAIPKF